MGIISSLFFTLTVLSAALLVGTLSILFFGFGAYVTYKHSKRLVAQLFNENSIKETPLMPLPNNVIVFKPNKQRELYIRPSNETIEELKKTA